MLQHTQRKQPSPFRTPRSTVVGVMVKLAIVSSSVVSLMMANTPTLAFIPSRQYYYYYHYPAAAQYQQQQQVISLMIPSYSTPTPPPATRTRRLHMATKKSKSSSSASPSQSSSSSAASSKMQVRLLHHIAGTGQAGEIILVTPAFYNNKLRPQHLAEPITDEQVQALQEKQNAQQQATLQSATRLQEQLCPESGFVLKFTDNKTGPDGKRLFGGISTKKLLQQLQSHVDDPYLREKQVKVVEVVVQTESGKKLQGDIKETGEYIMKLQLTKDIPVNIQVVVE
jgi:ribosomal protein L9